jgi:hypothetical protein
MAAMSTTLTGETATLDCRLRTRSRTENPGKYGQTTDCAL